MDIKLLEEYNKLLVRFKMAVLYLDSKDSNDAFIPAFQKLTIELNKISCKIKESGVKVTDIEILEGFHIDFRVERYKKYNY